MSDNFFNDLLGAFENPKQTPSYIGRKTPTDMFKFYINNALIRNEQSSARLASLASRAMTNPASLTLSEISSLGGSVLTQAPNR